MTFLAGVKLFLSQWWKTILIALAVAGICYPLGRCDGARDERARADAARAEANVEALKTNQIATDAASNERLRDATQIEADEERLIDAIREIPDTVPDANRVALGCQRLRERGTDTAAIPACR